MIYDSKMKKSDEEKSREEKMSVTFGDLNTFLKIAIILGLIAGISTCMAFILGFIQGFLFFPG